MAKELTVVEKLDALYRLQEIDTKIDKVQVLKGELPIEVSDLEDTVTGVETRINKLKEGIIESEEAIAGYKIKAKESENNIAKYEQQQQNVKNNREYDALSKEIELQKLEIELCEKKTRDANEEIANKKQYLEESEKSIEDKRQELEEKNKELEQIIQETEKEEQELAKEKEKVRAKIEERMVHAYDKIRNNYRNGLAVVPIERNSCGGCFNKIPPQKQMEIKQANIINLCDHCGRILVFDQGIIDKEQDLAEEKAIKVKEARARRSSRKKKIEEA